VLSSHRLDIGTRLARAGVGARFVVPQSEEPGAMLPPLRAPLFLDSTTFSTFQTALLLAEASNRPSPLPTIVLVREPDSAVQHLAAISPAVYAVFPDTDDFRTLLPVIRLGGMIGEGRRPRVGPLWVGLAVPPQLPLDGNFYPILAALAASACIEEAAERCRIPERTLYRRLSDIRQALGLPPSRLNRYRPLDLARLLIDAFSDVHSSRDPSGRPSYT